MLATVNEHPARVRTLCIPADCSMRQAESRLLAATTSTRIADLARQQAFASRLVAAFEQGDLERVDSLVQPFLDATIATIAQERREPHHSLLPRTVRSIRNRIIENLGRTETVAELARVSGTSARSASRLFKMRLLVSIHKFRLCARISAATQRLLAGDTVTTTSLALGFVDDSHLTKHFKRMLGVSPSAYAKAVVRLSCRALQPTRRGEPLGGLVARD